MRVKPCTDGKDWLNVKAGQIATITKINEYHVWIKWIAGGQEQMDHFHYDWLEPVVPHDPSRRTKRKLQLNPGAPEKD